MISFYRYITIGLLVTLPLFPFQIDLRINYLIYIYAVLLLLLFIPELIRKTREGDWIVVFWLFFILAASVSTYFSIDQTRSLYTLGIFLSTFVVYLSIGKIFKKLEDKEKILWAIIFVTLLLSFLSFYNTLFRHYVNKDLIGVSFMWVYYGHNHLSALLLFAIPFSLYFLIIYWNKTIYRLLLIACCLLLTSSLFLTFSKGGVISIILATIISLVWFKVLSFKKILLISSLLLLILILFFINIKQSGKMFGVYRDGFSFSARDIYWQAAIKKGLEKPIFGYGLDTFKYVKVSDFSKKTIKSDHAHNFLVEIFYSGGILGFTTASILIGGVFWGLVRHKTVLTKLLFIGLLASFLNSLVDLDWQLPTVFLMFWLIASFYLND